jgi:hypothetical protein
MRGFRGLRVKRARAPRSKRPVPPEAAFLLRSLWAKQMLLPWRPKPLLPILKRPRLITR